MNTNTIELKKEEMETVVGGDIISSIKEYVQAMEMAWDIHNCETNDHCYEWQGEVENEVHFNMPFYWKNKILVCTKCGKKKVTTDYVIVDDIRS